MLLCVQYDQRCNGVKGTALKYTFENTSDHQVILVMGGEILFSSVQKCLGTLTLVFFLFFSDPN